MADAELAQLMAQVQAELGAVISKPKLAERLLERPPFRYLYDIFVAVAEQTGFGANLLQGEELNITKDTSKQTKVDVLTKFVDCVGHARGGPVDVSVLKIVTGKEPERTNALLLVGAPCHRPLRAAHGRADAPHRRARRSWRASRRCPTWTTPS